MSDQAFILPEISILPVTFKFAFKSKLLSKLIKELCCPILVVIFKLSVVL